MKLRWYLLAMLVLLILLSIFLIRKIVTGNAAQQPIVKNNIIKRKTNPHLLTLVAQYEQEIVKLQHASNTPGAAIAIVKDSTIVYLKGIGVKSADKKDPVDENTVFRIASVSKPFAAFLTGILVEDSVLKWDDHVINYLPDFSLKSPEQTRKLNLIHVLSHTTGLPYHTYTNLVEEGIDLNILLGKLKDVQLANEVGKAYSYQNVAYSIIGEVIRKATGKTYELLMSEKVFKPLGMKNASIDYQSILANVNVARPHKLVHRKWVPTTITNTYYNVAPAGGINASAADMAQWMIALLGHRINVINVNTLNTLYTPAVLARSKNRNYGKMQRLNNSYYGLGWRILHYPNDTIIYHGGYVNGYRSEVALDPKDDFAVCILANAPGELADNGIPLFLNLYALHRDAIMDWENRQKVKDETRASVSP